LTYDLDLYEHDLESYCPITQDTTHSITRPATQPPILSGMGNDYQQLQQECSMAHKDCGVAV